LNINDTAIAAVPDLVVFEKTRGRFFPHFHIKEVSRFLVGEGDEVIVSEEGKKTNDEDDKDQRKGNAIEADPPCLKGGDLAVARECAEGEKGGEENRVRNRPLEGCLRNLVKDVFEHQIERGVIPLEEIHLLEKDDDDIDEDQTAQA
jgi:hypothetical protein